MAGHDDARSGHGSICHGHWGKDDDYRGHRREHHHRERRNRENGERRHHHQVNIMDFVWIGPLALTGDDTADVAEV